VADRAGWLPLSGWWYRGAAESAGRAITNRLGMAWSDRHAYRRDDWVCQQAWSLQLRGRAACRVIAGGPRPMIGHLAAAASR